MHAPATVTVHAHAKINWFLHITGRITTGNHAGYHRLQSVFSPISLADEIDITVLPTAQLEHRNPMPGVAAQDDLMIRAASLLQQVTGCRLGARLGIQKNIPMGGGLGGGSADAAAVLAALNHLWQTQLNASQLQAIGLQLGADVPFFLLNPPIPGQTTQFCSAFVQGIGEDLNPIRLTPQWLVLGIPKVHVPTPMIFKDAYLKRDTMDVSVHSFERHMDAFCMNPAASLFGANDMQPVAQRLFPPVAAMFQAMNAHLPGRVRMSGSGGCVFGVANSQLQAQKISDILMGSVVDDRYLVVTTL